MKNVEETINVSDVISDTCLKITITGVRTFKIRMHLGIKLFKLAAWITGCKILIENKTLTKKPKIMETKEDYIDGGYHDIIWNPKEKRLYEFMENFETIHGWKFDIQHMFSEIGKDGNLVFRFIIK